MEKAWGPAVVGVGALFLSPAVELIANPKPPVLLLFFLIFKGLWKLLDKLYGEPKTQPSLWIVSRVILIEQYIGHAAYVVLALINSALKENF